MNPPLYERDVERVVNMILSRVSDALAAGDRVELRGLGTFAVKERAARSGRNPKTGETVAVDAERAIAFKTGRGMHLRMNPSGAVTGADLDGEVERMQRAS